VAGPLRAQFVTSLVRAPTQSKATGGADRPTDRPARLREREAPPEERGSTARTATASPRSRVASGRRRRRDSRGSPSAISHRDGSVHWWRRRARRRSRVETRARRATPTTDLSGSGGRLDRTRAGCSPGDSGSSGRAWLQRRFFGASGRGPRPGAADGPRRQRAPLVSARRPGPFRGQAAAEPAGRRPAFPLSSESIGSIAARLESRGPSRLPASRRRAARRAIGSAFEGTPSRPFPRSSCLARSRQRRDASGPSRGTQGPAA
jgi:hypothetical protein